MGIYKALYMPYIHSLYNEWITTWQSIISTVMNLMENVSLFHSSKWNEQKVDFDNKASKYLHIS